MLTTALTLAAACNRYEPIEASRDHSAQGACFAVFDRVAIAWEREIGFVPVGCWLEPDLVRIEIVDDLGNYEGRIIGDRMMLIADGDLVYIAAHEWLHALAQCVDGDDDAGHNRPEVWGLLDGLEFPEGECLSPTP